MKRGSSRARRLLAASSSCYVLLRACCFSPSLCGSFLNDGGLSTPRIVRSARSSSGQRRASAAVSSISISMSTATGRNGHQAGTGTTSDPRRLLENLKVGERLKGVVVSELEGKSGKKAWVSLGVMRRSKGGRFSPVDGMIRLSKEKGLKPKKVAIDRPVTVYVSKVLEAEGRLEVSLRAPKPLPPIVDTSTLKPLADLKRGEELAGVVKTVTQFAAFVECGVGRPTRRLRRDGKPMVMEPVDGFLGKEDILESAALSEQLVKTQEQTSIISQGDRMKVYVKEAFPGNGRFHLTLDPNVSEDDVRRMKNAAQRKKARFARRKDVTDLVVGEEMLGGIVRVFEFGFFVDVGAKANGLVHISSISEQEDRYLGNLSEFADVGDKMHVKVDGVDEEGRLSLAYVAREKDRPGPPNRRERRRAERGERDDGPAAVDKTVDSDDDGDQGGFLFESPKGSGGSFGDDDDDDDDDGFDIFTDL
eukprot:g15927.t2